MSTRSKLAAIASVTAAALPATAIVGVAPASAAIVDPSHTPCLGDVNGYQPTMAQTLTNNGAQHGTIRTWYHSAKHCAFAKTTLDGGTLGGSGNYIKAILSKYANNTSYSTQCFENSDPNATSCATAKWLVDNTVYQGYGEIFKSNAGWWSGSTDYRAG